MLLRACALVLLPGCSLILDFSGDPTPPIDAPFSQAECDFKEPNDTLATAATLELTDVGPAAICPKMGADDHDFYKITVPANSSVSIKISYVFSAAGDIDLALDDTTGTQITASRGFDNDELIVCPGASPSCGALPAGDYIIEVLPSGPGKANRYDIAITVIP